MSRKTRTPQKPKERNLVAKHSRDMGGAGVHQDKKGKGASREKQKRTWKKEVNLIKEMNDAIRSFTDEEEHLKGVEDRFDISLQEGKEKTLTKQQKSDITKLVGQYKKRKALPSVDEIGNDLEMLEYNPEEIDSLVSHISKQLK